MINNPEKMTKHCSVLTSPDLSLSLLFLGEMSVYVFRPLESNFSNVTILKYLVKL